MGYMDELNLLKSYGIDIARTSFVKMGKGLEKDLVKFDFPFIAKVDTNEPIHKTELKAVKLVENKDDLQEFLKNIRPVEKKYHVNGIVVQEALNGIEVFIGGKRDPQFGQVILFGLGGIFVEIVNDYSIRLCPVSKRDARDMVQEIRGYPLLVGARGMEPVNMKKLVSSIVNASKLMMDENIKELDINPLFANSRYVKAADVRVIR